MYLTANARTRPCSEGGDKAQVALRQLVERVLCSWDFIRPLPLEL